MIFHKGEIFAVDPRFERQMIEAVQQAETQQVSYISESSVDRPTLITELPLNGVAVIQVNGAIYRGRRYWSATWDILIADLKFLKDRPSITSAMIVMDSPGGSAMGCQEACDIVDDFGKPIVAFVAGYACSAAYRFACHCDQIFATKSAQIGSIGTALMIEDSSKRYAEMGIEVVAATTGDFKSFARDGLPVTAEHRQFMAERVAVEQAGFAASLTARGLTAAQQAAVSDGRYWSALEAQQLGLIDGIKSISEMIDGTVLSSSLGLSGIDDPGRIPAITQSGSAGLIEGSGPVSGATGQPAADSGTDSKTVSIAEIKQLCPGASSDFVLQQAELTGNTAVKVLQAFSALQQSQIADLQKAQADATAATQHAAVEQQRLAATIGTAPVGSAALTQGPADGVAGKGLTGGIVQQFEQLVEESAKTVGRRAALGLVIQEQPELHQQYMQAVRKMTPAEVAARRVRNNARTLANTFEPAAS